MIAQRVALTYLLYADGDNLFGDAAKGVAYRYIYAESIPNKSPGVMQLKQSVIDGKLLKYYRLIGMRRTYKCARINAP